MRRYGRFWVFLLISFISFPALGNGPDIEEAEKKPPLIIVDPGHGGKDPGAFSRKTRTQEKSVVLSIAKKVSANLKKKLKAGVFLTRNDDRFVTLQGRNLFANRKQCDLFLSIHANAAAGKNAKEAKGIEIYYLNKTTDEATRRLASRENAGAPKNEKEIEGILSDLIQTESTEESIELAHHVRKAMGRRLGKKFGSAYSPENIRIKKALFYVLVGAKCPSLLIETGYVTHPQEGKRLRSAVYQKGLAEAITEGVAGYLSDLEKPGEDL